MLLTTEAGGQYSNRTTMPVPQQFDWTRVNTLQFITTPQAYDALWKVKLLWLPDVIFNILCIQFKSIPYKLLKSYFYFAQSRISSTACSCSSLFVIFSSISAAL